MKSTANGGNDEAMTRQWRGIDEAMTRQLRGNDEAMTRQWRGNDDAMTKQWRGNDERSGAASHNVLSIFPAVKYEKMDTGNAWDASRSVECLFLDVCAFRGFGPASHSLLFIIKGLNRAIFLLTGRLVCFCASRSVSGCLGRPETADHPTSATRCTKLPIPKVINGRTQIWLWVNAYTGFQNVHNKCGMKV